MCEFGLTGDNYNEIMNLVIDYGSFCRHTTDFNGTRNLKAEESANAAYLAICEYVSSLTDFSKGSEG